MLNHFKFVFRDKSGVKTNAISQQMKLNYYINKRMEVGSLCECPSCGYKFTKTQSGQAFCKSKKGSICKDKYWNTITPVKIKK